MAKIAIDAGHGKNTAGKRCLKSLDNNETREWVLNDRVADSLATYLKRAGHEILRVDDTDGSTDISLADRVQKANEWKADYYAAIHHNAGIHGGTGGGTIVFVYPGSSGITLETQKAIYKHAVARAGLKGNRDDGTITANYYVLRKTTMPASLTECGFMDSATDIKYILDPNWSKKIAFGIAEGICEVFGGKVAEPEEVTKIQPANSFDDNFAGSYVITTADLKLRTGAGTKYDILASMAKGDKVQCYGYYTKASDGTIWLYVIYNGQTGFVSRNFLKK